MASLEELRRRALAVVDFTPESEHVLSTQELRRLVHELSIHQVELEMQNEDLRTAERALEQARDRYFELFDLAPIAYATIDADGRVGEANLCLAKWLGSTRDQLRGRPLVAYLDPDDVMPYHRSLRGVLAKEKRGRLEVTLHGREGTLRSCELRAVRLSEDEVLVTLGDRSAEVRAKELEESFAQQLLDAQERERERLAVSLHDKIGQSLAAVGVGLSVVEKRVAPELAEQLEALRRAVRESTAEVRRLARGLYVTTVDDLGLARALTGLVADTGAVTQARVSLELPESGLGGVRLPIARLAYLAAQEGLANALRHAAASKIEVRVELGPLELELDVLDDGKGLAPDAPGSRLSLGLWSLSRRAGALGGTLDIESAPERGTTLRLRLPLITASP
jgi:PAS domain S-box-containing protein